jgi:hypothetical protein
LVLLVRCRDSGGAGGRDGDGDLAAEGFELPDQITSLAGGVGSSLAVAGPEVGAAGGRGLGEVPDDDEHEAGHGDQRLAVAPALTRPR